MEENFIKIKLGNHNVKVIKVDKDTADDWSGKTDYNNEIIWLANLSKEMKQESLWHEICHFLLQDMGYNDLSDDEKFVNNLSRYIMQILVDNKDLTNV